MLHIDQAYKSLLDRGASVEMADKFDDAIELLLELVDYGTNLIPRAYIDSSRDLKAICLLFVQLRQFVAHLDGISTLLTNGAADTANLQLRSVLEMAHTIEWILVSDTEEKIRHLYVANLRRRRQWDRVVIPGTSEAAKHSSVASRLTLTAKQRQEIVDEANRIDTMLASAPFDTINSKFEKYRSKTGFDKPWYEVYGASSIRNVSDQIGKLGEYTYIYSSLSGVTHGSDMWRNVVFGHGRVHVGPIREPQHIPQIVQLAATYALGVYRLILKEFRKGEEENFNRKYVQEWRRRFLGKYNIQLTPTEITI
jgi:Family of unknown function (DUF5677)